MKKTLLRVAALALALCCTQAFASTGVASAPERAAVAVSPTIDKTSPVAVAEIGYKAESSADVAAYRETDARLRASTVESSDLTYANPTMYGTSAEGQGSACHVGGDTPRVQRMDANT